MLKTTWRGFGRILKLFHFYINFWDILEESDEDFNNILHKIGKDQKHFRKGPGPDVPLS